MSLNPHMKAFITHGRYDLVTPYYASDRLRNLMRLDPEMASRLTVRHFDGGHMFYAWEDSRREFTAAIAAFVADAGAAGASFECASAAPARSVCLCSWLGLAALLCVIGSDGAAVARVRADARRGSPPARGCQGPLARRSRQTTSGTPRSTGLPVDPRSAAWLAHMAAGSTLPAP